MTNYRLLSTIALVAVVLFILMAIYYLLPIQHVLASGTAQAPRFKHAILFFGLAVLSFIGARFARNQKV